MHISEKYRTVALDCEKHALDTTDKDIKLAWAETAIKWHCMSNQAADAPLELPVGVKSQVTANCNRDWQYRRVVGRRCGHALKSLIGFDRLEISMHPSAAFAFARIASEYARWRDVPERKRSDAPGWWWGPTLAVRSDTVALPASIAASFALPDGSTYGDAAAMILRSFADQTYQPWPDNFPEKYQAKVEDPAASAEPAAQAASLAVIPIA